MLTFNVPPSHGKSVLQSIIIVNGLLLKYRKKREEFGWTIPLKQTTESSLQWTTASTGKEKDGQFQISPTRTQSINTHVVWHCFLGGFVFKSSWRLTYLFYAKKRFCAQWYNELINMFFKTIYRMELYAYTKLSRKFRQKSDKTNLKLRRVFLSSCVCTWMFSFV